MNLDRLVATFNEKYHREPRIFRAPGRVNLIGEHTDYNDGFVLPAAIDFSTYAAAALRDDRRIRVASMNFEGEHEFDLDEPVHDLATTWAKYVHGVGMILEREGFRLGGADLLIDSGVPVGAGLSSSAALEVATAFALGKLSGHDVDPMKLARIGQMAEHEFAGVSSGIMDQFAAVFGRAGNALFLDCRSMEWSLVPISNADFYICNTKTKHDLAESEYNRRRAECEAAAEFFGKSSLRDVGLAEFDRRSAEMPETPRKRARHVINENQRVLSAVGAIKQRDLAALGKLLNASHESLRNDFEVSTRELDVMADIARSMPGVLGARMTGGGFGGCVIVLMATGDHQDFTAKVGDAYHRVVGIEPEIYTCKIGDGVKEIEPGSLRPAAAG